MLRAALARVAAPAARATRAQSTVAPQISKEVVEKAKGPWNALSAEEKVALYRSAYPLTRREAMSPPGDAQQVLIGVAVGLAVSVGVYKLSRFALAPRPSTMNPEWEAASEEKKKKYNMNPTTQK